MELRVARHTQDLKKIRHFYTHILGLTFLGSFEDHDSYSGIFLGLAGENWHLEFTISIEAPQHHGDPDDLLVFYSKSDEHYQSILERLEENGIESLKSKNPYWDNHGAFIKDPDGFGIIIAKKRH